MSASFQNSTTTTTPEVAPTIKVTQPEAPKRRRFGLTVEVVDDELFIETAAGDTVLAFRPGWYLQIGRITINAPREADRIERMWSDVGREVGRREAENTFAKQP